MKLKEEVQNCKVFLDIKNVKDMLVITFVGFCVLCKFVLAVLGLLSVFLFCFVLFCFLFLFLYVLLCDSFVQCNRPCECL